MEYTDGQTIITFDKNDGKYQTIEEYLVNYEQEEELMYVPELFCSKICLNYSNVIHFYSPVHIKETDSVTAVILPSSGTTGKPKFICLSHAMLLSQLFRTP